MSIAVSSDALRRSSIATLPPRTAEPLPVDPPVRADMVDYGAVQALDGVDLLRRLRTITSAGHVAHSYLGAAEELFANVDDPTGSDRVVDRYSAQEFPGITGAQAGWRAKLSVEHTWPRAEGARGTAEADLHHLRVTSKEANGRRGDYPFGDVTGVTQWMTPPGSPSGSRLGTDAAGALVFEPASDAKGDIARGLLYFATRYGGDTSAPLDTTDFQRSLTTLLRWHAQDPVDAAERARNDAVAAYQGNRNPYVDHPEFAERVGAAGFLHGV